VTRADDQPLELRTMALALLASLLLWNLPFGGLLLYPFKLLATWLHELSHGLTMMITGAGFDRVLIYRDTSGLAYAHYRIDDVGTAFIAAAGYMGTPVWGALLLVVTPGARSARWALGALAALMAASAVFVVGNEFGQIAVGAMAAVAAISALVLPPRWRVATAHFVAAQSCINALLDIRVLLRPSQVVNGESTGVSDAHSMAMATFGSPDTWAVWTWAILWLAWSLAVLYVAVRLSGSRALQHARPLARAMALFRGGSDRGDRRCSPATARDETGPSGPADTATP
jgi:hypothetical protein